MQIQKIKNIFWHYPKGLVANLVHKLPTRHLCLIGVTGTDGKTTTCILVHKVLENAGIKSGLLTTVNSPKLHNTSPNAFYLQKTFAKLVKEQYTHCVCEATSHGLDQNRFLGCNFFVSAITNTSHEHLDYHLTFENYVLAKAKLFQQSKYCILNKDDKSFSTIKPFCKNLITYSTKNIKNLKITKNKLSFDYDGLTFVTDSPYEYLINNILAAYNICKKLNIDNKIFLDTLKNFPETKGRREEVKNNFQFKTIIDFAHTPAGLEKTLSALKKITKGKLIVIFGATGGRDKSKRPLMGKIVSELADIAYITSDDTRNENIEDINEQIISGIIPNKKFSYFNIPNRQEAFNQAIKNAKADDTIIACGKGHETTILHRNTEYPWSEAEAFRTAFRERSKNV